MSKNGLKRTQQRRVLRWIADGNAQKLVDAWLAEMPDDDTAFP